MQINEIHDKHTNQRQILDNTRWIGGPHSLNVTSQWLVYAITSHSSQYIISPTDIWLVFG